MALIRIVLSRAPGLIPGLVREIDAAADPVVLVPESFTLACETEIVSRSRDGGFFGLKIFSPSSLVREVRELTGRGNKKPVSADGQNMILSRLLHHYRDRLRYYRDSAAQPTLAARIAGQLNDFTRARLTPDFLREYTPESRRTAAKLADLALLWDGYLDVLSGGFEDNVGQWASTVRAVRLSGLLRGSRLLIWGFDYITRDILSLAETAADPSGDSGAEEVVIGLVCDDAGPDREIFRTAGDSVRMLTHHLKRAGLAYSVCREENLPPLHPGIAYVEKNIFAMGPFAGEKVLRDREGASVIREDPAAAREAALSELASAFVPDLRPVRLYYARNSYLECQHACQALIGWHRAGIPWEDMAVAVCEPETLPALLPLALSAAGIPFNAKQDRPLLMSAYAQYFLSLLRILRLGFCREDVIRLAKTGLTDLAPGDVMDLENYALKNGIHRSRWLRPFHLPEREADREKALRMEEVRKRLVEPVTALHRQLSRRNCGGRQAAEILFDFVLSAGVYERLLAREEEDAARGDDLAIDRNRQAWTAVNGMLDTVATFVGEEPLPLPDLCAMLEASLSAGRIKSLPQRSGAVMVAPPQMFFSAGVRCMIVMGLQESELSPGGGILSDQERTRLESFIEQSNREYYSHKPADGGERPWSKIAPSLMDLAARRKQDIYQAVSLAREQLMLSCSAARPSGGILVPSAAFRRLSAVVRREYPENVTGGLLDPDLGPFAPAFALEALAVRLRDSRENRDAFLSGASPEDALWRDALAALWQSEEWKKKTEGVLDGLRVAPPAASISPDRAKQLYVTHSMTISRVETFGSCPYRHFLQYGLGLVPSETFAFRPNEQGTFNHDVIKMFLDRAMRLPEWPDLSEETQARLLNRVLRERAARWEGGILRSDTMHRYMGAGIIRSVRTAIAAMMRSFRLQPHFLPMAAEIPFGTPDESGIVRLPALEIQTADGETVRFTGRIDRIDTLEADGKKYFMILDNKLSDKEVRRNSITAGLQLQLPLYIRAAREGLPGWEPAGGVYQPVREILVESEDRDKITEGIDKGLQTRGLVLDTETVRRAMTPVKISPRSEKNDTVSAVSAEELEEITACALDVITDRVNRIRSGEADPRPVQDGPHSPCEYCDHPDACRFDLSIPGCRVAVINHK